MAAFVQSHLLAFIVLWGVAVFFGILWATTPRVTR